MQGAGTTAARSVLAQQAAPHVLPAHQLLQVKQEHQQANLCTPKLQALVLLQPQEAQAHGGKQRGRQSLESIAVQVQLLNGCMRERTGGKGGCAFGVVFRVGTQYLCFHLSVWCTPNQRLTVLAAMSRNPQTGLYYTAALKLTGQGGDTTRRQVAQTIVG